MHRWLCIQVYIPENPGKTVKVLVLRPASAGPLIYLQGQLVFTFQKEWGQLKVGRGKAVFAVAHILPVEPQGHAAFHSLEGNVEGLSLHLFWHMEIFYIACSRVKAGRDFPVPNFFPPVPWVLGVDIGRDVVPFHLDMGRHPDVAPVPAIVIQTFKPLGGF